MIEEVFDNDCPYPLDWIDLGPSDLLDDDVLSTLFRDVELDELLCSSTSCLCLATSRLFNRLSA